MDGGSSLTLQFPNVICTYSVGDQGAHNALAQRGCDFAKHAPEQQQGRATDHFGLINSSHWLN